MDFKNLKVSDIIIHQIYKRNEKSEIIQPFISKKIIELDAKGMLEFQTRIIESCGDNSHSAEMKIKDDSKDSLFQNAATLLTLKSKSFVQQSEIFAHKLADAQSSRKYPDGLLVIFTGTVGKNNLRYTGLLKAEPQHGFSKQDDGDTISLKYLDDLVLTPAQKYYKLGIYIEKKESKSSSLRNKDDFSIIVYDQKLTEKETRLGSIYFYESFLGCEFAPTDKKLTQDFYDLTKTFIKNNFTEEEERLDMLNSLYTYLKNDLSTLVSPKDFSDKYIIPEKKDKFEVFFKEQKFPARSINKDTSYIQNKLKRRTIKFNSKVTITAPSESFEKLVHIESKTDTETFLKIFGVIEELK